VPRLDGRIQADCLLELALGGQGAAAIHLGPTGPGVDAAGEAVQACHGAVKMGDGGIRVAAPQLDQATIGLEHGCREEVRLRQKHAGLGVDGLEQRGRRFRVDP
jgi:hypothetical protein